MDASPTKSERNAASFHPDEDNVFARIAGRYDGLCDVFSLYAHRLWKSRMAQKIADHPGGLVLDVASGTGDIPLRVLRQLGTRPRAMPAKKLLVSDLCPEMLAVARSKLGPDNPAVEYAILDAHHLREIESSSIDLFSIAFGMKICDRQRVLSEAQRVLKPGGSLFCLEAARIPVGLVHAAYLKYMDWCLPTIARLATGGERSAYDYLLKGIHDFPDQSAFAQEIEGFGFRDVAFENLSLGIVALHEGVKR